MAWTLDIKIIWFGCQKAVCVTKRHTIVIYGCNRFHKFNFGCLLLKLLTYLPTNETVFNFVYPLGTQSSIIISETQIYSTLICHMSHVVFHLSLTPIATATDPPPVNSPIIHSRLAHSRLPPKKHKKIIYTVKS